MRRVFVIAAALLFVSTFAAAQAVGPDKVIDAVRFDTSPPLRDLMRPVPEYRSGIPDYEVPNAPSIYEGAPDQSRGVDPMLQERPGFRPSGAPVVSFEGIGRATGGGGTPPDTVGDVGPNHYFQSVNIAFSVWDKNGNLLAGPSPNNSLWDGFGGTCESQNAGDPIVVYDPLADRWNMSQFTSPGGGSATQCFAISKTGDPLGQWHRYQFPTPGNDYPKVSVWHDAYYAGIRNFSGGFNFDAYAFERAAMLNGTAAQAVVFNMSALLGGITNFIAFDVDGPTPAPAGTPGTFIGMRNPRIVLNELTLFELDVDWNNPANSSLSGPISVPTAAYDGNVCNFNRACIPQPDTNRRVDGFADAMMHRAAYRNFGTHQSVVCSHAVDVGDYPDHSGIRWHEIRNTGSGWTLHQEGTYAPDFDHRWMPSIAQNANGDIMLGYSVSSKTTYPSIRYTGRLAGDPLNQMTFDEGTMAVGGGSQTGLDRWGDYSAMSVDPADETTFWYTQEYYQNTSSSGWQTRVAAIEPDNGPPTIDIRVDPVGGKPLNVGPPGASFFFDYDITVDNNGTTTLNAEVWNRVTLPAPESEQIGPVQFTIETISVPAGGSWSKTYTFEFPGRRGPGTYQFSAFVGDFAATVMDRDNFYMIRSSAPSRGDGAAD